MSGTIKPNLTGMHGSDELAALREENERYRKALESAAKSLETCGRMFRDVPQNDIGAAQYAYNRAGVARDALSPRSGKRGKK